jgi:ribosomal protein S20
MSISSVSTGTTATYASSTQQKDLRNAFKQMSDAIANGDLQDAQNAFANLAQLMNGSPQPTQSASSASGGGSDFSNLLNQVGSALQSGDLDQATQALQNLQQSAKSGRAHHHHHHGGGGGAGIGAVQNASDPTSASTDAGGVGGLDLSV